MEQLKSNNNLDCYSSHLNLALTAISTLCSAKPISPSEFVSVITLIKEWPSNNLPSNGM